MSEVIIDGNGIPCCDKCNKHPNCYFKQLQRVKSELEQYKKSKQASYEAMQTEWNNAINELRKLKATDKIEFKQYYKIENDKLKAENEKLKKEIMLIRQGYDEESCIETCPEVQALRKELDNFRRID